MSPAEWYARQRARLVLREAERCRSAGEADAAVAAFERAAALDPHLQHEALDAAASLLIDRHRPADAVPRLQALAGLDKTDTRNWRRLAQALAETGDRKAAIKAWRRVLDVDAGDLEANRALAEMLPDRRVESIGPLRVVAEAAGRSDPKPWRRLAKALERNGQAEAALEAWQAVLAAHPGDAAAHERLAALLDGLDRQVEAALHLRATAEASPSNVKAWKRLARALEALGEGQAAFKAWRRVLELNGGDAHAHGRLAELLLAQGLKSRALGHIRSLAEAGANLGAWRRLARLLTELSRPGEAVQAWRRVLEIAPDTLEAHQVLADLLEGDPAQALEHLRAVTEATPKEPEVWRALGRALAALDDAAGAVEAWRRLLKLDGDDLGAHAALAGLVSERKALPHLEVLAERGPDLAGARRRLAVALEKSGDKAAARRVWEDLLALTPEDLAPHERLAEILNELGEAAAAVEHLRWLAVHAPGANRWRRLAQALGEAGDLPGEMDAWRRLLDHSPADLGAHERLAQMLEQMGRKAEAAGHLRLAAEADPSKNKPWKRLARLLQDQGQGAEAFKAWRRVLELDPADRQALNALATLLLDQGLKARALVYLQALADSGEDRTAWRRLAQTLTDLARPGEAIEAWRRVAQIAPGDAQAHEALAELLQADPAAAAPHARALAEAAPKRPEAWRALGRTLTSLGDTAGAGGAWRRVLKLEPDDIEAHAALADLLGDRKGASRPHLEVLAARGPDQAAAQRRLAQILEKGDDKLAARQAWEAALALEPADISAHERLAELLAELGDAPAALDHLRWLADHAAAGDDRPWRRLARALAERGDTEGELDAWRRLLEVSPRDGAAHDRLAGLLGGQGRTQAAAAHLRALAEIEPDRPKPWKRLARALGEAGEREAALDAWRRVLEADAQDPHAHDQRGRLLLELGRPDEAAEPLRALALADAENPRRWKRLADALEQAGDGEGEADAWRRVLALDAADLQAHDRLAQLLETAGAKAEAAPHLRALAEADASRARPWRRLAQLLDDVPDADSAIEAWARVLAREPGDLTARERLAQLSLDRGRPADAVPHLEALAQADAGRTRSWRRLAGVLQQAGEVEAEMAAWRRVLGLDENDVQAHERLAHLLTEAGRETEALSHLQAVVRIAPENAKAWRRHARALRSGQGLDDLGAWRQTLALAGQGELEAQLKRTDDALRRTQALKEELRAAGAELKRERGAAQHALSKLEAEARSHRSTQALLKDELAERRRLVGELQESGQRRRQAEAEESSHLLAGRLLGLLEPLAGAAPAAQRQGDAGAAYVEEGLRAAAAAGALVVAEGAGARIAGADVIGADALPARLRGRAPKIVVLADPDPQARETIRASLAGRRGLTLIDLPQLAIRRAAGVEDLKTRVEPVSDDVWPSRPVMVMSGDERLLAAVTAGMGKASDLAFAPLFPRDLAGKVQVRELDLDDWLAAAWSAAGRPRHFGFQFDPESLALFAREIRSGRAPVMAKVFRRANALALAWSDKALYAAADHFARTDVGAADFDAGDAQIEVKTYKRLIQRDMLLESAAEQLGKFRPATVKAYRELFDKQALGRFCRDAGLALGVSGFAQVEEAGLAFRPPAELVRAGALIAEAVRSLTAVREPEAPPAGLVQYGLGRSLEALGRHAEAFEAYRDAVVRAPTYFPARAAAARYLELAGRPGEAEGLLRQGLGNGTPDADVQEGLLDFYQRNGSPLGVAATSRLMLRRGQSRPAVAAPALIELGRYRDAEPLLQALAPRIAGQDNFLNDLVDLPALAASLPEIQAEAAATPDDVSAQLRLAEALRRLGRLDDSLGPYAKALASPAAIEAETGAAEAVRPQFLMVGPPRTGTTLLRRLFDLHPQIATPSGELFFFSSRTGQRAGSNRQRAPLSWYLGAFKAAAERKPDARVIGEKTPHYFSTTDAQMAFAALLLPQVKIIATLRDPVVRAWSEIKVQRRATEAEIVAALSQGRHPNWLGEIIDAGRYVAHLKRWLRHVTPDRLLLVDSEALETNVVEEAGRIFRWLGVRELPRRQVSGLQQGWNNRTEGFAASEAVRELLRRAYEGEPWTAEDVGRAVGLGDVVTLPAKPSRSSSQRATARRRAAAK